jgi:hypothetical protein
LVFSKGIINHDKFEFTSKDTNWVLKIDHSEYIQQLSLALGLLAFIGIKIELNSRRMHGSKVLNNIIFVPSYLGLCYHLFELYFGTLDNPFY